MLGLEGGGTQKVELRVRLIMRISRINWSLEPQSLFQAGFFVFLFFFFLDFFRVDI